MNGEAVGTEEEMDKVKSREEGGTPPIETKQGRHTTEHSTKKYHQ